MNVLYFIYTTTDSNYVFEVFGGSSSNTFDYNLINEAISLTNGAKKSGATTYAKSDSKIGQIKIGDSLSKE